MPYPSVTSRVMSINECSLVIKATELTVSASIKPIPPMVGVPFLDIWLST